MEALKEFTEHTTTKTNIKFATYNIPEFDDFIQKPLNDVTLIENNNEFNVIIKSLIQEYSSLITSNVNNFNELFKNLEQNPLLYYFICIMLEQISLLLKNKLNKNEDISIEKYPSIEELIKVEMTKNTIDNNLKNLINIQYNTEEIKNKLIEKLLSIFKLYQNINNNPNKEIGIINMNLSIKFSVIIFNQIIDNIKIFKNIKEFKSEDKNILIENEIKLYDLILLLKKLEYILIILHNTYFLDPNDIFNKSEDSKEWENIKKNMTRIIMKKEDSLKKALQDLDNNLILFKTVIGKGMSSSSNIANIWNSTTLAIGCSLNKNKNLHESKEYDVLCNNIGENILKMSRIG